MSTLARVIFDPDTIAPSVPAGLAGVASSSTRIDLSWGASTDTGGSGLTGYLVYRGASQIAQVGATSLSYSDTGLLPSTLYQYQVAAIDGAGNTSSKSTVVSVTTQAAPTGPPAVSWAYPTAALYGIAGTQDYPSTAWSTYAKFNMMIMGGYWEGHTSLNRQAAVTGIKAASTLPTKTLVFQYMSLNEIDTSANGVAYGLWRSEVQARNWLCYLVGTTGSPLPSLDGAPTQEVLYTDYAGTNPSLEYPYEFGAKYCFNAVLTTTREVRFTSLSTALVATNLDGISQDNWLCDPGLDGDFNRDQVTERHGSPTVITPWLQAGQLRYCNQMRALAPTKYVMANYGGGYGDPGTVNAGVMQGVLDGGTCESFIGKSWSRDTQFGFAPMMAAYYKALDVAKNPQMVVFQGSWPDTASDGSALPRLPTANGYPPVYTLPQYCRYIAGCAYLGGGMAAINKFSSGYSSNLADIVWPDEFDQAGAAALGWLGNPLAGSTGVRPTGARFKGLWVREFDNGAIVVNPSGNGTQTFTSTDLPGNFKTFAGTQDPAVNNNTTFTSITMSERDARFLVRTIPITSNPLSLPLATNAGSAFTYLGRFNVPSAFQFGGAGLSVLNGVMYSSGLSQSNATLGSMQLPTKAQIQAGGSSATTIKAPVSVPGAIGQAASASNSLTVGSCQYLGNLYINLGIFYNSANAQTGWLVKANTGLTSFGTPQGMSMDVAGLNLSNWNANLGYIPSLWQPTFGGYPLFVAGGLGLGIASTLCCGPFGFGVFTPDFVSSSTNNVPTKIFLDYPYGGTGDGPSGGFNSSALWNRPNVVGSISGTTLTVSSITVNGTVINQGATLMWAGGQETINSSGSGGVGTYTLNGSHTLAAGSPIWISNTAKSPVSGVSTGGNDLAAVYDGALGTAVFLPGTRTIAAISVRHFGPESSPGSAQCDTSASGCRDPRRLQISLFDAAAIVNARNAGQAVSTIQPYQWEIFPNSASLYGSCPGVLAEGVVNGFFAVDPVTNIMYGSALGMGGSTWFMDAWQIGSGPPPPPSYSTTFQAVQSPLSENGNWYNRGAPANGFTRCVVSAIGQCNGSSTGQGTTQNPGGYDDSYDLIPGFELYPQQFVQFTVKMKANLPQDGHSREVEGRLWCSQDNSGGLVGLEVDLQYNDQSVPVVWWTGAPGSFAEAVTGLSLPQPLANGQVIRIQITSSGVVSGTQNGVSMGSVNILTDNNLKNIVKVGGNPGIGFFIRPGANATDVGISAFSCGTF